MSNIQPIGTATEQRCTKLHKVVIPISALQRLLCLMMMMMMTTTRLPHYALFMLNEARDARSSNIIVATRHRRSIASFCVRSWVPLRIQSYGRAYGPVNIYADFVVVTLMLLWRVPAHRRRHDCMDYMIFDGGGFVSNIYGIVGVHSACLQCTTNEPDEEYTI